MKGMKGMRGGHAQHGVSAFEREMDASMARMMQDMHGPGFVGQADIDFLAMMIPHHAGAVDMARLVLQHGRDPATRQLAEEIIAGQEAKYVQQVADCHHDGVQAAGGDQFCWIHVGSLGRIAHLEPASVQPKHNRPTFGAG